MQDLCQAGYRVYIFRYEKRRFSHLKTWYLSKVY